MKLILALAPLVLVGCRMLDNRNPEVKAEVSATPDGPCRDDESFDKGHCSPRIPGNGQAPR